MPEKHVRRAALTALIILLSGCAPQPAPPPAESPGRPLPAPAEPEPAPPAEAAPPGQVIALPGGSPEGAEVDAATATLTVALREPDRIALVDLRTRQVRTVDAPGAARHLVSGGDAEVLVLGENTNTLDRVELPAGRPLQRIPVGRQPHDAAQLDGTTFVSNELDGSVGVVRDGRMIRELRGLAQPGGIAATGGRVAAVDVRGNALHVFDAATLREVAMLPAGKGPSHVRPTGPGRVAVADTRGNAVLSYDLSGTPRQLGSVTLPGRAYGLATDNTRDRVYATLANTNRIASLRVEPDGRLTPLRTAATVGQPNDVAVDPRTGAVHVIGTSNARVQVLDAAQLG